MTSPITFFARSGAVLTETRFTGVVEDMVRYRWMVLRQSMNELEEGEPPLDVLAWALLSRDVLRSTSRRIRRMLAR